jgi:glycosyltransferase involved in cell wall biosynthesis
VARVIGRLNIGGPAVQALHLTRLLDEAGFDTRLYRGSESRAEGSMDYLAADLGVRPVLVRSMRRDVGMRDVPALGRLVLELRRYRPHIVHTEAAKAGTLGRLAALLAFGPRRPVLIHTFHGHSLEGYFSPRRASAFLAVERFLARRTTLVIAVSEEVKQDLVRLAVTTPDRIRVIPLGLDLEAFRVRGEERAARREADPGLRFAVVGDGELREELQASPEARALGGRLLWTGFERDMPAVCFASDCVVLTSDNEGTPVSLIEAQAAGVPTVSTRVGGAASVVHDGQTGRLVDPDDEAGFAAAVLDVLDRAEELGEAGRAHVERFSIHRLAADLSACYRSYL